MVAKKGKSDEGKINISQIDANRGQINVGGSENTYPQENAINTGGGVYIGGSVSVTGGDFVGRDKIEVHIDEQSPAAAAPEAFAALLEQMQALLQQSTIEGDTAETIEGDFLVIEKQSLKPKPNGAIILSKLNSIADLLNAEQPAGAAAQLLPLTQQALALAKRLFG